MQVKCKKVAIVLQGLTNYNDNMGISGDATKFLTLINGNRLEI